LAKALWRRPFAIDTALEQFVFGNKVRRYCGFTHFPHHQRVQEQIGAVIFFLIQFVIFMRNTMVDECLFLAGQQIEYGQGSRGAFRIIANIRKHHGPILRRHGAIIDLTDQGADFSFFHLMSQPLHALPCARGFFCVSHAENAGGSPWAPAVGAADRGACGPSSCQ
jgi:hypothetical protein